MLTLSKSSQNPKVKVLAIKVLNQITIEMSFKAKKISPSIMRRISLNFRETHLKHIFEDVLSHFEQVAENYQSGWR
jgi:hypothetical protein